MVDFSFFCCYCTRRTGNLHCFYHAFGEFVFLFTKWKCLLVEFCLSFFLSVCFSLRVCVSVSLFSVRKLFKCVLTKDLLVVLKGVRLFAGFSHSSRADWLVFETVFHSYSAHRCCCCRRSNVEFIAKLQSLHQRLCWLFSLIIETDIIYCVIQETWFLSFASRSYRWFVAPSFVCFLLLLYTCIFMISCIVWWWR